MWVGTVPSDELFAANRWTVAYFAKSEALVCAGYPTRLLREVVRERRGATDPQQLGEVLVNYLGLENIRSRTGELVDFQPRKASSVKSRSKIFRKGDVLFGRLRPELNKVYLAEEQVEEGICSTEFLVLMPSEGVLIPRYLRHILASRYVTQFAQKYKSGAALPRMDVNDLLSIPIPVPPLAVQEEIAKQLTHCDRELSQLRSKLEALPSAVEDALIEALEEGQSKLSVDV